jgi:hypothetical protein
MKPISTQVHGVLDYVAAATLILLPRLLGWSGAATTLLTIMGIATIIYSLVTRYELSVAKLLPMAGHLALDGLSGLALIVSAFLLPAAGTGQFIGLIALGVFELGASLLTQTHSSVDTAAGARRGVYDTDATADAPLRERAVGEDGDRPTVGIYDNNKR